MIRLRHLVLVRHGETKGESSVRYHGINDVPLSAAGRAQMQRVAAALADIAFDAVYTSALQRTVTAARIVAPGTPAVAVREFNEINFGDWEGLTRREIEERDPQTYRRWLEGRHDFAYPGGDSIAVFRARVVETFRSLSLAMPPHTLIIGHKGVISAIVADLLGLSAEEGMCWPVDLASIHVLQRTGTTASEPGHETTSGAGGWQVVAANRTDHLME